MLILLPLLDFGSLALQASALLNTALFLSLETKTKNEISVVHTFLTTVWVTGPVQIVSLPVHEIIK